MRRRTVCFGFLMVLFSNHALCAADLNPKYQTLENALGFHQQLFEDAKHRVGVASEREKALAEFRQAVEMLRKMLPDTLTMEMIQSAEQKLTQLESFLPQEGLAIAREEKKEEAASLLRLDAKERSLWQPGVSTLSFGRFGWKPTDGLLSDTVAFDSIQVTEEEKRLGRIGEAEMTISVLGCDLKFPESAIGVSIGPKGVTSLKAKVVKTNWIGKEFTVSCAEDKEAGRVCTSLQRLATRFDYNVPAMTCAFRVIDAEKSSIGYFDGKKYRTVSLAGEETIKPKTKSWVLLDLVEKSKNQHVLIVLQFQRQLKKIEIIPFRFTLVAETGSIGNVFVYRPRGIERQAEAEMTPTFFKTIDRLCRLNLAWPARCDEYFRIDRAKGEIIIRNDVEFEMLCDDWSTEPMKQAAVPPLLMLAKCYNVPVRIDGSLVEWNIPTKYGHFATVDSDILKYTLPLPPLYRHGAFAIEKKDELVDFINRSVQYQGGMERTSVDWAYRGLASTLQAWCYLSSESRGKVADIGKLIKRCMSSKNFWRNFKWRIEPFTGRRYCYDFPRGWYLNKPRVDINWGNALTFYGLDQWAAYTGEWGILNQSWSNLWALSDYLVKSHDWAWMADSITECGEGAAIDCLAADYAGLIALARIAKTLDKSVDVDRALYLAAKTAIPHAMRFAYLNYIQKYNLWHDDSPDGGTVNGFHEFNTWIHPKHAAPWWGFCSLSGFGVEPECFDAMFFYAGKARMSKWWQMVHGIYPEWYNAKKTYPAGTIYGGNSNYVTTPGLYLEFRMGAKDNQLKHWAKQAGITDGAFQNPNVFAEIVSRECPVQLADWGRCTFDDARYDPEKKLAIVRLGNDTKTEQQVIFICRIVPKKMFLNQQMIEPTITKDFWGASLIQLDVRPGSHIVEFNY